MRSSQAEFCTKLREAIDFLNRNGVAGWEDWFRESLRLVGEEGLPGIEHAQRAFGGMGSFNDLVIQCDGQIGESEKAANETLDRLRHEIYELAWKCRREGD